GRRRSARPRVVLARLRGPRQLVPLLMPSFAEMGPLTMSHTVTGLVVVCMLPRLTLGSATASAAAMRTGRYSGGQPAITALIAMRSTVAAPNNGTQIAMISLGDREVSDGFRATG